MKSKYDFTDTSLTHEERFAYLTSEVNGRAHILDHLIKNLSGYLDQLEAEVDGNPAAENYLDQCIKELGKSATVISEVAKLQKMDQQENQLMNLVDILKDVKDRAETISEVELTLNLNGHEECLTSGNRDQFTAAFIFLVNYLSLKGEGNVSISLEVKELDSSCVSLSKTELPHKKYWFISLGEESYSLDEYKPALHSKNSSFKNKLFHRDGTLCYGTFRRSLGDIVAYDHDSGALSLGVMLPVIESGAVTGALDEILEEDAWRGDETVLVVDDEDMIWEILIENLQELGYTVILAEHGEDAVQIFQENPGFIDVVILDMVMPKMNGREAFGELKKIDENVKVLLSSGYMAEGEAGDLLENGAKGFLRKPYKMIDLAKMIRKILD
ncbi:MAG: response regulator [Lentisphaerales bacterium]|nr:response regulator [Lentisphaerales bacterium]